MLKTKKIGLIAVLIAGILLAVYFYIVPQKDNNLSRLYPTLTPIQHGTISQNGVNSYNIFVGEPADKLSFSLEWKNIVNQLDVELVDPDGVNLKKNSPALQLKDNIPGQIYAIPNYTKSGKWIVRVLGS